MPSSTHAAEQRASEAGTAATPPTQRYRPKSALGLSNPKRGLYPSKSREAKPRIRHCSSEAELKHPKLPDSGDTRSLTGAHQKGKMESDSPGGNERLPRNVQLQQRRPRLAGRFQSSERGGNAEIGQTNKRGYRGSGIWGNSLGTICHIKLTQRLLVTCIARKWPLATVFFGTRLGSQKSGNQIPV